MYIYIFIFFCVCVLIPYANLIAAKVQLNEIAEIAQSERRFVECVASDEQQREGAEYVFCNSYIGVSFSDI